MSTDDINRKEDQRYRKIYHYCKLELKNESWRIQNN